MIESIYIRNFGIIDEAEFNLGKGFNVITGETGTGKSMIVNAMGLVFGRRLGSVKLSDTDKKTIIEMVVSMEEKLVVGLLERYDIDRQFPLIIRREITTSGRSRAFVNDTPVTNTVLKELAALYVDVSEQHETLSISQRKTKFNLVDGYAGNDKQLQKYQNLFHQINKLESEIENKEKQLGKLQSEQDYYRFQLDELDTLDYKEGEEQSLKEELDMLENSEVIKQSLYAAYQKIDKEEYGLSAITQDVIQSLKTAAGHHKFASEILDKLTEIQYDISEIGAALENEFEQIEYSPQRLQEVEERLSTIYRLTQKHGIESADKLTEIRESYQLKLTSFEELTDYISTIKKEKEALNVIFNNAAIALTKSRKKYLPQIEKAIRTNLRIVAMPTAEFSIKFTQSEHPHILGVDDIDLLFSANRGVAMQPINQVASGGELSRLMLAIKSVLGIRKQMPTHIFDEIDSGISGETATKVGEMMQELSNHTQLLVISHLPQIAAKANQHFVVDKNTQGNHTNTVIRLLDEKERVKVIATMVSGNKNSFQAKQVALEMIG